MTAIDAGTSRNRVDPAAAATMVALCLVWAFAQVAIKVANGGLQPVFQSGLRAAIAAILVLLWCRIRGIDLFARDGTLVAGIVAGILFGGEFVMLFVGLDFTSVSRGIIFLYTAPLFVAVGAHFLIPGEALNRTRTFGLVAAFVGVAIALSDRLSLPSASALFGDALCLCAAMLWGATSLVIKTTRLRSVAAEKVLAYQLGASAVIGLGLSPLFGPLIRNLDWVVVGVFAYQVIVVITVSYGIWFWLLVRYPAAQLASFTFLTPVFTVLLGGLLLSEPMTLRLGAALALVAAGITLVNRPSRA